MFRRNLPEATRATVSRLLDVSIAHALSHREEAVECAQFGRGLGASDTDTFVGMYVNGLTLDYGQRGRAALSQFFTQAFDRGLIPAIPPDVRRSREAPQHGDFGSPSIAPRTVLAFLVVVAAAPLDFMLRRQRRVDFMLAAAPLDFMLAAAPLNFMLAATPLDAQDAGVVKVDRGARDVRSEPNDKAPVVAQVTAGTVLTLQAIEGDWFRVQLPSMGAIRVERVHFARSPRSTSRDPHWPRHRSRSLPSPGRRPSRQASSSRGGRNQATWLASRVAELGQLSHRRLRPRDRRRAPDRAPRAHGCRPDAGRLRLGPRWGGGAHGHRRSPSGVPRRLQEDRRRAPGRSPAGARASRARGVGGRVVGMVRGRADEITRTTAEWDVMRDFRQDTVKAEVKNRRARRRPHHARPPDLPPGEYAIVIRPPRKRLIGAVVLSEAGEGRLFRTAWIFVIR